MTAPWTCTATAVVAGHFGEFLQGRLGPGGPVALVTLPCPALGVTASAGAGAFALEADPDLLSAPRARALLAALGLDCAGRFRLGADMPPGGGAGASTAALVALARAAAALARRAPPAPGPLAAATLAAEGASDPLMHASPAARLWAPRAARTLAPLAAPPGFDVVGGFLGAGQRTDPTDTAFPDIADLAADWRTAAAAGDRARLAHLASLSAARCTALRGPGCDPVPALARRLGALGHARAHTGSARALLFAPGTAPTGAEAALAAAGLAGVLRFTSP